MQRSPSIPTLVPAWLVLILPRRFLFWLILAWSVIVAILLAQNWAGTGRIFADTDDAMRLVQMRDWLAGQGWFDLRQYRLEGVAYESHWSRLIDAGLAGLFFLFRLFAPEALAERLMLAVWPLLWLLPVLGGACAIAWRIAGREAAKVVLAFALCGAALHTQFVPGRIDHHNVQIALALLALAATLWTPRFPSCAPAAGLLGGLGLVAGFEALPVHALCGAAFMARYIAIAEPAAGRDLRRYALALAATTAAGFFVSVGPGQWTRALCDALAFNSAVAVVGTCAILAIGGWLAAPRRGVRVFVCIAAGMAALAVLLATEPACLRGPYAQVDPAVEPIWLSLVSEHMSLWRILRERPEMGAVIAAPLLVQALALAFLLLRVLGRWRDPAWLLTGAVFAVMFVLSLVAVRFSAYALWVGAAVLAAFALEAIALLALRSPLLRLGVVLALTPWILGWSGLRLGEFMEEESILAGRRTGFYEHLACRRMANFAPLAALPPGLVVSDPSTSPFILVGTRHRVAGAPYHRASAGIIAAHQALAAPPDEARGRLLAMGADYITICGSRPPGGLSEEARNRSLWAHLRAGAVPEWLDLEASSLIQPFTIFRLRRAGGA